MSDPKVTTNDQEAQETGYVGSVPDKTPNSAYTVAGQAAGEQTPESSRKPAQQQASEELDALERESADVKAISREDVAPARRTRTR